MDNQENNQFSFINAYSLQQKKFFKAFAKDYLAFLGNAKPTAKQITEMKNMLSHVWMRQAICFDLRLTEREQLLNVNYDFRLATIRIAGHQ